MVQGQKKETYGMEYRTQRKDKAQDGATAQQEREDIFSV